MAILTIYLFIFSMVLFVRTSVQAQEQKQSKALTEQFHRSIENRPGQISKKQFLPDESPLVPNAKIKVYQSSSTVILPAQIVQRNVLLEAFLTSEGGKSHESLLVTNGHPKKLNLSLIMAGFAPEKKPAETGPEYLGDPALPGGDFVVPLVEWQLDGGQWVRFRGEDLVRNQEENMLMRRVGFSFAGSYFMREKSPNRSTKEVFAASRIKTLIALFHDPSAILDLPVPQGGTDGIYYPRTSVLPPKGTRVRVILRSPNSTEQKEIEENIQSSKKAWSDRQELLRQKQERKQKSN